MNVSAVHPYSNTIQYRPSSQSLYQRTGSVAKAVQTAASLINNPGAESASVITGTAPMQRNIAFSGLMGSMLSTGLNISPAANPLSNLSDLYSFNNRYLYSAAGNTYAKIDGDGDGLWSYSELSDYADAYQQATGQSLDVDDLMALYSDTGDNSGHIRYQGQQQMYADDALGISHARDMVIMADNNMSINRAPTKINDKALQSFVDEYTYGSADKLYAKIDKNSDGVWTLDELKNYVSAYEKATGIKLDADALFAKYDVDGDGTIKYTEQNAMYRDDALGLSRISDALKAKNERPEKDRGPHNDDRLAGIIRKATNGLSASSKQKLWNTFNDSMQKAVMLDAFYMTNSFIQNRLFNGYGMQYNSYSLWTMGNMAMLNMFT